MGKLLAAFAGLLGLAWWRKRAERPAADDPAAGLRAKLAEARETEPAVAAHEPVPDDPAQEPEPPAEPPDVESRRRDVHERARAAMDDLSPGE